MRCPLCAQPTPAPFLVRDSVPVHQNLPAASAEAARAVPRGRLEMVACLCGFVFNRAFDPRLPRYGPGYDNTQGLSPAFATHLDALAQHLVETCGVRGARIIEVGCGQGEFLRRLVAWPDAHNTGVGYDPAYVGPEGDSRLRFERRYYGPDGTEAPPDVVVCRHVIEHIADPLALLRSIRAAIGPNRAKVFFETPDVAWSLRRCVLWDFFYEHCSLFTAAALTRAFHLSGFAVQSVRRVFGGQYLWLEAAPGGPCGVAADEDVPALAEACGAAEAAARVGWRARLAGPATAAPVAVWGAGAKGVTFAALADPDATAIDCLVDINPAKQGRFVPGTGHPIVAPPALAGRGVRTVVPMNPLYCAEIAASLPQGVALVPWDA